MRTVRLIAVALLAAVALASCASADHEAMVADAIVEAQAAGVPPVELAYAEAVARAAERSQALAGIAIGPDGNPVAPFTDASSGMTVTSIAVECQDAEDGLGWVTPILAVSPANAADRLELIDQRIAFYGSFGADGMAFEAFSTVTPGQEARFDEWGITGNPGQFSGDYAAICGAETWPLQVNLVDSTGATMITMLDAEVRTI